MKKFYEKEDEPLVFKEFIKVLIGILFAMLFVSGLVQLMRVVGG